MKTLLRFAALTLMVTLLFTSCKNDIIDANGSSEPVALSDVPSPVTSYIQTTFNGINILKVEKKLNADGSFRKYEVYLTNGVEIYFDANWVQFFDDNSSTPDDSIDISFSDLPQAAQDYVNTNYAGEAIKKNKKQLDDAGNIRQFEVRFDNDIRIYFNATGQFTGIRN